MDVLKKIPVRGQDLQERVTNFKKACLGCDQKGTQEEAQRCIDYKNARYIQGCSVVINIPEFISEVKEGKFEDTANIIAEPSTLPTVCRRVCPQENQCEGKCIRGIKGEPISIGKLERFVADWSREHGFIPARPDKTNGVKVVVIGSGPAGLTYAGDPAKVGYEATIFEASHEPGGVFTYGIPESRLPKSGVVQPEIGNARKLGVRIETNVIMGKSVTIDELMDEEGFKAVSIGSSTGLPELVGIPGESAGGVFLVNEYLTRSSLMKAFRDGYDTPIYLGKRVTVVGGGNVAMDAARTALYLGIEVYVVHRRSEAELPVRVEEVYYVKGEGIIFNLLTNPAEALTGDNGWAKDVAVRKMELGGPDASGHHRLMEIAGSDHTIDVNVVITSLGASPNPPINSTTEELETNHWKCIVADKPNGKTTKEGVYAGGDAVTGVAAVILAVEVSRTGARGIDEFLRGGE